MMKIRYIQIYHFVSTKKVLLLTLAFAFFLFGAFIEFTSELQEDGDGEFSSWDRKILIYFASLRMARLNGIAVDLTALGSFTVLTIFTILGLIILHFSKNRIGAIYLLLGASGSGVLSSLMKKYISRERPTEVGKLVDVTSFSYPSGHSLGAASFYLLVSFLIFTRFNALRDRILIFIFFALLILGIGVSRIYLGVHYPSDVFGGILLGSAWTFLLSAFFFERMRIANQDKRMNT